MRGCGHAPLGIAGVSAALCNLVLVADRMAPFRLSALIGTAGFFGAAAPPQRRGVFVSGALGWLAGGLGAPNVSLR